MRMRGGSTLRRALITSAAAIGSLLMVATPASAAWDDSFVVSTDDLCGRADFVDYGEGAPGGGNNDDYIVIHDYCSSDRLGVMAYAWRNGSYLGKRFNGNGAAGAPVVWDPFGSVNAGEDVGLKVCLVNGAGDNTPTNCDEYTHEMVDG